jgi:peptide-methionine (S)-S-oxide reductase
MILFASEEDNVLQTAVFAGGCFWCMEPPYDKLEGVVSTRVGYAGGHVDNPTYEQVSTGTTGHAEVVQILFDSRKIDYEDLLDVFWSNIDPTVKNRQFCDAGSQYRTAIFYENDEQKRLAEASKEKILKGGKVETVYTEIVSLDKFWEAEDYHQDYYQNHPFRYKSYHSLSGRERRLKEIWDK